MANAKTTVEILDSDLNLITEVRAMYPLNEVGDVLEYSKRLSEFGECRFRIATDDPLLTTFGDIVEPHKYHLRVRRENKVVWRGAIVDNPFRNKKYIEVLGHEYLYYFDKALIDRKNEVLTGEGFHYRLFDSGTMATNVSTLITELKNNLGANHVLSGLTTGTIENPNFPDGFVDGSGDPLTGAWTFSSNVSLQFDYHTYLYVLVAFGIYGDMDFTVDEDLVFDFKKFVGNKMLNVVFEYGSSGNLVDYEVPRYGRRMANKIWGIGATVEGEIISSLKVDNESVNTYGMLESPAAYNDVKDQNTLAARTAKELNLVKTPESSPVNLVLDENGYPLGQYDIGDIITVAINDRAVTYSGPRRVIGITVRLHNTGREMTSVTTNIPKDEDLAA
jgi:hypothetical protein